LINIYLVGMMGSGKSTVGKILAKQLGKQCIDLDYQIEKKVGDSIESIFQNEGELKFRYYETLELKKISNSVVACGGGIILSNENLNLMKRNGRIIYLKATLDELERRLIKSKNRPLLKNRDLRDSLEKILNERKRKYESIPSISVHTDGLTPLEVSNAILRKL
tara:strand:+ start:1523 stop:2014 length:492 start_codon:yes stop_codon:yes gene_type:complete